MKKYLSLVGVLSLILILSGAGCSTEATETSEADTTPEDIVEVEDINEVTETEVESVTGDWSTYKNSENNFSIQYPTNWRQAENGEPDPTLLGWVYFLRENPANSKGFDTVSVRVYSELSAGYEEQKNQTGSVVKNNNGKYYILNYSAEHYPEETVGIFNQMVETFKFL